jgi:hypothetical protein
MVLGLGGRSIHQGYTSKEEALDDYLNARTRGWVKIVRNAADTNEQFGHPNDAEDLPIE